jgi:hypothetical protein
MTEPPDDFEALAKREPERGLLREFWDFLKTNKKWWIAPLVVVMALFGLLIALAGNPALPWIYAGS